MLAKSPSSIQVIARLADLLSVLAAHEQAVSLKSLSAATGLHPSTAFRILASLIEHGFVERSLVGHYRLGERLLELGQRVEQRKQRLNALESPLPEPLHVIAPALLAEELD